MQAGKLNITFDKSPLPTDLKNCRLVVGTDVSRALFEANNHLSKILLVTHPLEEKNFGIQADFDKFALS